MFTPSDEDYKATKEIMLGRASMNPDFAMLSAFINDNFGIKAINIIYGTAGKEERPFLNICFEFESERQKFLADNGYFNYDRKKQKIIAEEFVKRIKKISGVPDRKNYFAFGKQPEKRSAYKTENLFVSFSAFEPVAKTEANEHIPHQKVAELKSRLNDPNLWEIAKYGASITFFLYSDIQKKIYEKSDTGKQWADAYFELLKPYDEFHYFKRDRFDICLDSKENFDNNYQSNWYYYYK